MQDNQEDCKGPENHPGWLKDRGKEIIKNNNMFFKNEINLQIREIVKIGKVK